VKKLLLALSLCGIVVGFCGTSFATGRPVFTSTTISVCKQLVDPGQPVCFTTQTIAFYSFSNYGPVWSGQVCFFDEFSGPLDCVPVNRFGQAQICLPVTADMDVSAVFIPDNDHNELTPNTQPDCFLLPSHSLEKAVFVTSDPPPAPQYFPGTHPGCLIPHIAPACN